jgi:hypothetical protein
VSEGTYWGKLVCNVVEFIIPLGGEDVFAVAEEVEDLVDYAVVEDGGDALVGFKIRLAT